MDWRMGVSFNILFPVFVRKEKKKKKKKQYNNHLHAGRVKLYFCQHLYKDYTFIHDY